MKLKRILLIFIIGLSGFFYLWRTKGSITPLQQYDKLGSQQLLNLNPQNKVPINPVGVPPELLLKKNPISWRDYVKRHPMWRPIRKFKMTADCAIIFDLSVEETNQLKAVVDDLRIRAGAVNCDNSLVAQTRNGGQVAYIPPDEKLWENVEATFRRSLAQILGEEKGAFAMESSRMELDLLTSNFGKYGKIIEIEPYTDPKPPSPEGQPPYIKKIWLARIRIGNLANSYGGKFEPENRAFIGSGNAPNLVNWQDEYTFDEVPDFLKNLVQFSSDELSR